MGQVLEVGRLIGHDPRTPRGLGLQAETHSHMNNKTEEGSRGNSLPRGGHGCVITDKENVNRWRRSRRAFSAAEAR